MGFLQQRLHLVLKPRPVARQLILSPRDRSPQTLFGIGNKTQAQFLGYQPLGATVIFVRIVVTISAESPLEIQAAQRNFR
jgi:hypothetical protein